MARLYLDYNASTPIDPDAAATMQPLLTDGYGNPSSGHWAAVPAAAALQTARSQVAAFFGCAPDEIVFTSGGSEANNLALKGTCRAPNDRPTHIVTSAIEHPAILEPCRHLARLGVMVTVVPVDGSGLVDPNVVRRAITRDTRLISVMHANNETGTIQPVAEIAAVAHAHGIPFHTDAAQSVGKIATRIDDLGADMLSVAGHKVYAPKGIGALYVRRGVELEPLIHGAEHESGRRAGTESALLAAALGKACEVATRWVGMAAIQTLRDRLWDRLQADFGNQVVLNGHPTHCLPNTLNVSFVGRVGADILAAMPDVAASTGSACHAGRVTLSPVLQAMQVTPNVARGAIRFSLGRSTTEDEVDDLLGQLRRTLS